MPARPNSSLLRRPKQSSAKERRSPGHCTIRYVIYSTVLCCIPTGTGTCAGYSYDLRGTGTNCDDPSLQLKARGGPRRGTRSFAAVIVSLPRVVPQLHRTERAFTCLASPTPHRCHVYTIYNISPLLYDIRVYVARIRDALSNCFPK